MPGNPRELITVAQQSFLSASRSLFRRKVSVGALLR